MAKEFNIKTPKAYDSNYCCGIGFVPYPEVEELNSTETDDEYEMLRIEQQGGII